MVLQMPLQLTPDRLDVLRDYQILDTLAEPRFDRLTRLASMIFRVPIALISLLDYHRQWFKSRVGLNLCETPIGISFCQYAVQGDAVLYVPDATEDARFASSPLVTGTNHVRFYAGAPLITPKDVAVGTLCILDSTPRRDFGRREEQVLKDLADLVVDELELRKALLERNRDRMMLASEL